MGSLPARRHNNVGFRPVQGRVPLSQVLVRPATGRRRWGAAWPDLAPAAQPQAGYDPAHPLVGARDDPRSSPNDLGRDSAEPMAKPAAPWPPPMEELAEARRFRAEHASRRAPAGLIPGHLWLPGWLALRDGWTTAGPANPTTASSSARRSGKMGQAAASAPPRSASGSAHWYQALAC